MNTETRYTVKQLATMSGVSARTLHYYDQIGLLTPTRNPENGYRIYEKPAVLRLQQILFLRELGLSLEDIQVALDQPDFDMLSALERHRKALLQRQHRLAELVRTVDRTILHLKGNIEMNAEDLFAGFSEEQEKEYAEEATQRWGETARESQRRWSGYTAEQKQKMGEEASALYKDMVAAMPFGPSSPQAQAAVALWHQHMRYFYEPTKEIMLGLVDAYVEDPRFNAFYQKIHPDLAEFMREAVQVYCKKM